MYKTSKKSKDKSSSSRNDDIDWDYDHPLLDPDRQQWYYEGVRRNGMASMERPSAHVTNSPIMQEGQEICQNREFAGGRWVTGHDGTARQPRRNHTWHGIFRC